MNNRIKIVCKFSFRGEIYTPTMELDLDEIMVQHRTLPDLYPLLAERNGINLFSYEYEMLEAEPLMVEVLDGWVDEHVTEEQQLDIESFEQRWHDLQVEKKLQAIIDKHQLALNSQTLAALKEAHQLGKSEQEQQRGHFLPTLTC